MKKELLSILSSKSNDCTIKSKITDKLEENSKSKQETPVSENTAQNTYGSHVLIISEDSALRKIISESLSDFNVICEYTNNGEQAILQCNNLPVDYYSAIFIGDLTTDSDGIHTAEILKGRLHISAPIIAVSSNQCNDPYIDAYISPVPDTASVIDIFSRAINGSLAISKEKAMARLGNRQDLYDKYYKRFIAGYADASCRIRQLLASGSYEEAYRLAHSIKGLAGTLGLAEVYISSSRLCSALKVDQTSGGQYLNELEVSINRLLP